MMDLVVYWLVRVFLALFVIVAAGALGRATIRFFRNGGLEGLNIVSDEEMSVPEIGQSVRYPDRNDHLRRATFVGLRRGMALLHVGHPHNRPFSRPLREIRAVA